MFLVMELAQPSRFARFEGRLDRKSLLWLLFLFILGISALILAVSSRFWSSLSNRGPEGRIGELQRANGLVRLKGSDELIWTDLNDEAKLYDGDAVFTGEQSRAHVELNNGLSGWVDADSMVVIHDAGEQSRGIPSLVFGHGVTKLLSRANEQRIEIEASGKRYVLQTEHPGTEFEIQVRAQAKSSAQSPVLKVAVSRGSLTVAQARGNHSVEVQSGDALEASSEGHLLLSDTPLKALEERPNGWSTEAPELLAPLNGGRITTAKADQDETLEFRWKNDPPAASYELRIEDMEGRVRSPSSHLPGAQIALAPGTYHWQVRRVGEQGQISAWSETFSFDLLTPVSVFHVPPIWVDTRIGDLERPDILPVSIHWPEIKDAVSYEVSIYQGDRLVFQNHTKETSLTYLMTELHPQSNSYEVVARVEKSGGAIELLRSGRAPIRIDFSEPRLIEPQSDTALRSMDQVLFTWESTLLTQAYEIEIARDEGFQNLLYHEKTEDNFFTPKISAQTLQSQPGRFYWRVRALGNDVQSGWSESRMVQVIN